MSIAVFQDMFVYTYILDAERNKYKLSEGLHILYYR